MQQPLKNLESLPALITHLEEKHFLPYFLFYTIFNILNYLKFYYISVLFVHSYYIPLSDFLKHSNMDDLIL